MSTPELAALIAEITRLRQHVHGLENRVRWLETPPTARPMTGTSATSSRDPDVSTGRPPATLPAAPTFPGPAFQQGARVDASQAHRHWWQIGPLRSLTPEQLPSALLAALGGLALLLGLLFFVWYSVEQGWLSPVVRVTAGGIIGATLLAWSWRLAQRGQAAVAGGVGGAGLGAWFAAWLVARHVHEFVGSTEAFVALGLGCAAALVIAGTQRLRAMAWIGALGAVLTPIATSDGSGSLNEVMIYQGVVLVALTTLEIQRKWSELLHIGMLGTWMLMASWFAEHGSADDVPALLLWTAVMLLAFSLQAFDAYRRRGIRDGHIVARQIGNGLMAWLMVAVAAATARNDTEVFAWGTLAMALGHGAMFLVMRAPRLKSGRNAVPIAVAATWAWLQLFVFAPAMWADDQATAPWMALWWTAMVLAMAGLDLRRSNFAALIAGVFPFAGVLLWSGADIDAGRWQPALGFLVASLPLGLALTPRDGETTTGEAARGWLLFFAGVVWSALAWNLTEGVTWARPATAISFAVLAASTASMARKATPTRVGMTVILGLGLLISCYVACAGDDLFAPDRAESLLASARAIQLATVAALASLAWAWTRGFTRLAARDDAEPWIETARDSSGLLVAFSCGLGAMIAVAWWVTAAHLSGGLDASSARSLAQAGYSSAWAACALVLLLQGLRQNRSLWRLMALTWLALTGLKLVFVDLSNIDLAWRVLSFVSLGACLLIGAYAYRRFLSPTVPESPDSQPETLSPAIRRAA